MAVFSKTSIKRLNQCHTDLIILFNEVIKEYDCTIICGQRGEAAQSKAYNEGHSKLRFPKSHHNRTPSMAVDVLPYPVDYSDIPKIKEFAKFVKSKIEELTGLCEISRKIEWGGDWKFKDMAHWQIKLERQTINGG